MDEKVMRGTDWQRHEENVAKTRAERSERNLWDVGVSLELQTANTTEYQEAVQTMIDAVPDGLSICKYNEIDVYVWKDSVRRRAEVAVRADAVRLWGEAKVSMFDAEIFGHK